MKAVRSSETGLYEVVVDELKYEFEKWGAEDSYDTLLDLAKLCGKPIGLAVSAFGGGNLDEELRPDIISTVFQSIVDGIGDKSVTKAVTKKLVSEKCFCNGAKINFNTHYQDRLDHMFKVMWAALEVQYGNFFVALLGLVGASSPQIQGLMNRVPRT